MNEKWITSFWNKHGDRLVFATLAICLATALYKINMQEAAKTIYVGTAMLFLIRQGAMGRKNRVITF